MFQCAEHFLKFCIVGNYYQALLDCEEPNITEVGLNKKHII